jgi:hypothetical protein
MGLLVQILAGAERELQGRVLAAAHLSEHLVMVVEAAEARRQLEQPQQVHLVELVALALTLIRLGRPQPRRAPVVFMLAVVVGEAQTVRLVVLVVLVAGVEVPLVLRELLERLTPEAEVVQEANRHPLRTITALLAGQEL